jgi:hypothetical protein
VIVAEEPVAAVEELKQVPVQAVSPAGQDVEVAQVVAPPPPAEAPAAAPVAETLPKTASPLPLIGLFGLLALGAAFTLRFARARA